VDSIVSPGVVSGHVHKVAGGSNFGADLASQTPVDVFFSRCFLFLALYIHLSSFLFFSLSLTSFLYTSTRAHKKSVIGDSNVGADLASHTPL
jgi:hypothetical protein